MRSGTQQVDLENNETIAKGIGSVQDLTPALPGTTPERYAFIGKAEKVSMQLLKRVSRNRFYLK